MARDKTLDQMEYEDTILKNHRPKNTYVGLKGTVQILSEEDFANCKYLAFDTQTQGILLSEMYSDDKLLYQLQ